MSPRPPKFTLDANLFIDGFREKSKNDELQAFHQWFAPFEYLSAVVLHELMAGIRSRPDRQSLERHVALPFQKRDRLFAPTSSAWSAAADVLAKYAVREGVRLAEIPPSFRYDALLACSCRESGMVLVTRNLRDFQRIRRYVKFEFVEPWPAPPQ